MRMVLMGLLLAQVVMQADILKVEAGGGLWFQKTLGLIHYQEDPIPVDMDQDFNAAQTKDYYLWAFVKHPVPMLPNMRVEYTATKQEGVSGTGLGFGGFSTPGVTNDYTLALDQLDVALYYNVLDNLFWLTLDVGVDGKWINSKYDTVTDADRISQFVPMLYTRMRAQVPTSGFGAEAEIKYILYKNSSLSDIIVKCDYTFDMTVVDPAIEVGYRYESVDFDGDDFSSSITSDAKLSGLFVGVALRF
jgi:outer membrane protein